MTPTICLNMIVKNEAAIIERCLRAAAPAIDAWVICDTGSTDDTPERIERFFRERGIPGELHRFPFVNFGQARNEALTRALASALPFDYLLFADADMELVVDDPDFRSQLVAPAYMLRQQNLFAYFNKRLLRRDVTARYVGVTHEYLAISEAAPQFSGLWFIDHAAGSNRAGKFDRDAKLLEDALRDDPTNARYVFYLAQSWRDGGHFEKARDAYRRRTTMGEWDEEVWYSMYEVGRLTERLEAPVAEVQGAYLAAYQFRPQRAEPLYELARFHRERSECALAYMFAHRAAQVPKPNDILFVDVSIYQWRILDELGIAAYYVGPLAEGRAAVERILSEGNVPASDLPRVEANLRFYAALAAQVSAGTAPGESVAAPVVSVAPPRETVRPEDAVLHQATSDAHPPAPEASASAYGQSFYDGQMDGSLRSARVYLKHLFAQWTPQSVVDVGCGRGTWLLACRECGATRLVGVDGAWNSQDKMIDPIIEFRAENLDVDFVLPGSFDLAMSLEVAEHLQPDASIGFVETLCRLSDAVLFGAAFVEQPGRNHINTRLHSFWAQEFIQRGYSMFDVFRPAFWSNEEVEPWYRQNTFLYVKPAHPLHASLVSQGYEPCPDASFADCIHPWLYFWKLRDLAAQR